MKVVANKEGNHGTGQAAKRTRHIVNADSPLNSGNVDCSDRSERSCLIHKSQRSTRAAPTRSPRRLSPSESSRSGGHETRNLSGDDIPVLVCPGANDSPAAPTEQSISICIAVLVCLDLGTPPRAVRLRPGAVLRTAVPETSVDEHGNTCRSKNKVCASASLREWATVYREAKPQPMKRRANRQLTGRVAL